MTREYSFLSLLLEAFANRGFLTFMSGAAGQEAKRLATSGAAKEAAVAAKKAVNTGRKNLLAIKDADQVKQKAMEYFQQHESDAARQGLLTDQIMQWWHGQQARQTLSPLNAAAKTDAVASKTAINNLVQAKTEFSTAKQGLEQAQKNPLFGGMTATSTASDVSEKKAAFDAAKQKLTAAEAAKDNAVNKARQSRQAFAQQKTDAIKAGQQAKGKAMESGREVAAKSREFKEVDVYAPDFKPRADNTNLNNLVDGTWTSDTMLNRGEASPFKTIRTNTRERAVRMERARARNRAALEARQRAAEEARKKAAKEARDRRINTAKKYAKNTFGAIGNTLKWGAGAVGLTGAGLYAATQPSN